jgi:hypothetical protein
MQRNGRRLVYTEERVRALFAKMRADLHEQHFRHLCELSDLRRELDQVRAAFDELRSVTLARSRAELEVAELRRLREIGRAQTVTRDPARRCNERAVSWTGRCHHPNNR